MNAREAGAVVVGIGVGFNLEVSAARTGKDLNGVNAEERIGVNKQTKIYPSIASYG